MSFWASKHSSKPAFTIVELLIVIVVIAILAAITIVAYTGIQDRAKQAALQSAASQASKKILAYAALNTDLFPPDEATFFSSTNLQDTPDTDYTYLTSPDRTHYCISATNPNNSTLSTAVSDTSSGAVEGRCVRNLAVNPGFEASVTSSIGNMGGAGTDSTRTSDATWADSGTKSALVTKTVSVNNPSGTKVVLAQSVSAGDVVRWAAVVKNNTSSAKNFQAFGERSSPTYAALVSNTVYLPGSATIRILGQYTITSSNAGTIGLGVLPTNPFAIGESYNIDSIIVTVNSTLPNSYKDGSSTGWSWDGAPNASTSFGPAVLQ